MASIDAARRVGGRLHQRNLGGDLDHFLNRAGGKLGVGARRRAHADGNVVSVVVPEALLLDGDAVGAQRQFRGHVPARSLVETVRVKPGAGAEDLYLRARDGRSGAVRDRALNASAEGLRTCGTDEEEGEKQQTTQQSSGFSLGRAPAVLAVAKRLIPQWECNGS